MRQAGAVRAGGEHLAGQHAAVAAVDLADAGDVAAQAAAAVIVVALLDEDDEVDRARDEHVRGLDREPLRGLQGVGGDAVEHFHAGVGVDGRQGAVVALGHRVEHGDDLVAEHLADDHAAGVHPQGSADQLGHADLALALGVGQALLEGDDVRVQLGELVEAELQGSLDGDEALARQDLVGQGAQQRRLSRVRRTGDHDVLPGADRRREETANFRAYRAISDQVGKEDLAEAGAANGDGGLDRHVHHRAQPRTVRQAQVELWVGGVERPARQPRIGGQDLDELDQLLVGLGHRLPHELLAVGIADEHLVAAVDVDVLDLGVVEQRLQTPHAEQRRVNARRERLFLLDRGRGAAETDLAARVLLQHLRDQRPGELALVLARHRGQAVGLVEPALVGQAVADLLPEPLDEGVIDHRAPTSRPARSRAVRTSNDRSSRPPHWPRSSSAPFTSWASPCTKETYGPTILRTSSIEER